MEMSGVQWSKLQDLCQVLQCSEECTWLVSADDTIISMSIPLMRLLMQSLTHIKELASAAEEEGSLDDSQPLSAQGTLLDKVEDEEEDDGNEYLWEEDASQGATQTGSVASANIFRSALQIIEETCTDNRHYSITEIQFKTDTRRNKGPARKLTNYEEKGRHERWMNRTMITAKSTLLLETSLEKPVRDADHTGIRKHKSTGEKIPFIGLTKTSSLDKHCCQNGGTCMLGSFCACPKHFTGRHCEFDLRKRYCGSVAHNHWLPKKCALCRCIHGVMYCFPSGACGKSKYRCFPF
ncbi:unnamed protein product [Ranitomeya imitator]|uniref:EGF-like domain-containing protein n=1 Tax=Ranitomeya imitator TaxID=111125 RepID=A0ABN9L2T8_9NEOB|nr:unnamed protein product [Ranitomeya imitator]